MFNLYKLVNGKWELEETLKGRRKELAWEVSQTRKVGTWKLRKKNDE